MIKHQLKLFGGAFIEKPNMSFAEANDISTKYGYILHPQLCHSQVVDWVEDQSFNPNTTFYKCWRDLYRSDAERLMDQLLHYITSYYGNELGVPVYVPNENPAELAFSSFKTLKIYTKEDISEKVIKMVSSGIALSEETIGELFSIIKDMDIKIDLSVVKNKEFLMHFHKKNGTVPSDANEFIRFLVFLSIGKTTLIKDKATMKELKASDVDISKQISKFGLEKLATIYRRHKKVLLCLKNKNNAPLINKVARLSETHKQPYKPAFVETILSDRSSVNKLPEMLDKMTNFKKIALMQAIAVRMNEGNIRPFIIRNGKIWVKEEKAPNYYWYEKIAKMIYESFIDSLSDKACEIVMNDDIELALPTSEKNFIGNIPYGSYIDFEGKSGVIGINWRGEDGAQDLDLSIIDMNGGKIGWNSECNRNGVFFSGDMTRANPEATELITAADFPRGIVKVSLYNGEINSKLKFFFANEKIAKLKENYMVNPDNILCQTELKMDSKEVSLGIVEGTKFVFANVRTGNKIVSDKNITTNFSDYWFNNSRSFVSLREVLQDAGFTFVKETDNGIDLRNIDKSTLINLLS
jgi:hypothetical protein